MGDRAVVVLATVLVGVPVGLLVAWALARWRMGRGLAAVVAWRRSLAEVGAVVGTVPWVWMIMTPTDGAGGVRLVPFRDLADVLGGPDVLVQIVGNLLVFAALGFCLPVRFRLARPVWVPVVVVGIAAGLSAVLEVLQTVLALGRVSSVDDVIVNAVGAGVASLLSVRWWRAREMPDARQAPDAPQTQGAPQAPDAPQTQGAPQAPDAR